MNRDALAVAALEGSSVIPSHLAMCLQRYADAVVYHVCRRRLGKMNRPPRIEIDFVASMVENGAPRLERLWRRALGPGVNVRVGGVFTHQSPLVTVQGTAPRPVTTNGCELADLLVLHSHRTAGGKVFLRGVLMQTKIDKGGAFVPDDPQFWLYDCWPQFIVRSRGFDRRVRDFNGDRRSGRYGLVSAGGWLVTPPASPMAGTSPGTIGLGRFLVDMLYDMDPAQAGRRSQAGRQVYHNSTKDWSSTIMELVEKTGKRPLKHTGVKHGLYPGPLTRLGGGVLYMMHGDEHVTGGMLDGDDQGPVGEGGGFGVLVIETEANGDWKPG